MGQSDSRDVTVTPFHLPENTNRQKKTLPNKTTNHVTQDTSSKTSAKVACSKQQRTYSSSHTQQYLLAQLLLDSKNRSSADASVPQMQMHQKEKQSYVPFLLSNGSLCSPIPYNFGSLQANTAINKQGVENGSAKHVNSNDQPMVPVIDAASSKQKAACKDGSSKDASLSSATTSVGSSKSPSEPVDYSKQSLNSQTSKVIQSYSDPVLSTNARKKTPMIIQRRGVMRRFVKSNFKKPLLVTEVNGNAAVMNFNAKGCMLQIDQMGNKRYLDYGQNLEKGVENNLKKSGSLDANKKEGASTEKGGTVINISAQKDEEAWKKKTPVNILIQSVQLDKEGNAKIVAKSSSNGGYSQASLNLGHALVQRSNPGVGVPPGYLSFTCRECGERFNSANDCQQHSCGFRSAMHGHSGS